jgi:glycopeptide antibiotics resistance protein
MKKALTAAFYIVAVCYVIIMMDMLFRFNYIIDADRVLVRDYNLVPFKTILAFIREASGSFEVFSPSGLNLLGNIVLFIPCGVYVMVLQKNPRFRRSLAVLPLIFIAVEAIQFAFDLGVGDIDDVLLNTLGGLLGILSYLLLKKLLREEARAKTAAQIISLFVGVPAICLYLVTVFNRLRL